MPTIRWEAGRSGVTQLDGNSAIETQTGAVICRRLNASGGVYQSSGRCYPAEVRFPTIEAPTLTELFGFMAEIRTPLSDEIVKFRLSNDGGTTWLWWNGTAWAAPTTSDHYNTVAEIDAHLATFLLGTKRFRVQARLIPSTDEYADTPVLTRVCLYGEFATNLMEDVKRSLKRYVEANLLPVRRVTINVDLMDHYSFGALPVMVEPIHVYNLTEDPGRSIDLFEELVPESCSGGQTIRFTAPQTGIVEIQYTFRPRVVITTADAEIVETELPVVALQFNDYPNEPQVGAGYRVTEVSVSRNRVRERLYPMLVRFEMTMQVGADVEQDALAISRSLRILLDSDHRKFTSVDTGALHEIVWFSGLTQVDAVGQGIHSHRATLTLAGWDWSPNYVEHQLGESIVVTIGPGVAGGEDVEVEP